MILLTIMAAFFGLINSAEFTCETELCHKYLADTRSTNMVQILDIYKREDPSFI